MTEGTRSSFCAAALKLPVFATATKARIEAIVSILHDSRKLNRRQAPFSVGPARLSSPQCQSNSGSEDAEAINEPMRETRGSANDGEARSRLQRNCRWWRVEGMIPTEKYDVLVVG